MTRIRSLILAGCLLPAMGMAQQSGFFLDADYQKANFPDWTVQSKNWKSQCSILNTSSRRRS